MTVREESLEGTRPDPPSGVGTFRPGVFATEQTLATLREARALVLLVGSYDGSGNFGDIAQLRAAMALVERLGQRAEAVAVLEREYRSQHEAMTEELGFAGLRTFYFDPGAGGGQRASADDLVPVSIPPAVAFTALYFYGGGYFNRTWGDRKLAMAKTIATEPDLLLASGVQLDERWIAALDRADTELMGRLEVLGVRDPVSAAVARSLNGDRHVLMTGDDAVGLLAESLHATDAPTSVAGGVGEFIVNVHFSEHGWVTDDSAGLEGFVIALMEAVQARRGAPVRVRPLTAYADRRIDERPASRRLVAALRERGIEPVSGLVEPTLLRPTRLDDSLSLLREARMTVSCSYHVALTSLLCGVPTMLIGANEYYAQKGAGLREAFGLPDDWIVDPRSDPVATAEQVMALLDDEGRSATLARTLELGREISLRRRAVAERVVIERIGAGFLDAVAARMDRLERDPTADWVAERGELKSELAKRRIEYQQLVDDYRLLRDAYEHLVAWREEQVAWSEELQRKLDTAFEHGQAVERRLQEIQASRSWRMTRPLRGFERMLDRRRSRE